MTTKSLRWRIPLVAVITAACLYYAYPPFDPDGSGPKQGRIKFGLDLQGGMQLNLKVDSSSSSSRDIDAVPVVMEILRNRIDPQGVSEPSIQRQGQDHIIIQLPGETDRKRVREKIGRVALLEFKLVSDDQELFKKAIAGDVPPGYRLYSSEEGGQLLIEDKALLSGKYIKNAMVSFEAQFNEPAVSLEFNGEGAKIFSDITGANVDRRLAIILDEKVQSAPVINERIPSGNSQITGRFSVQVAQDLVDVLKYGALPAPVVIEEERSVGPSLGKDSVQQGIRATVIGFTAVIAFMAAYYLFAGLVANLALALNILIIMAVLAYFHGTLTLPGIAGIVLTIGMAVDTNVLIFERIREEQALNKPLAAAIMTGYKKAFVTILDANLTTLITAGILAYIGTGPVRGFAVTLAAGIVASMFTGIFVTRAIFDLLLAKGGLKSLKMLHFLRQPPKINYLKFRKFCYCFSLVVILVGAFAFVKRGGQMFSVDFSGGSMQEYRFTKAVEIDALRKLLSEIGFGTATIQRAGEENEIMIRSPLNSEDAIGEKIKKDFPDNPYELLRLESVGPIVGKELKTKALWAFLLSLVAIWVYVVWRFDFRFAFGAILALFHDGLVAVGFVALTGRELSITVLAAVLTILGYSI